jgi:DNA repair protein RadC
MAEHYVGHRQRLKERFISSPVSLPDYEILEMLLFCSVPRRDVKDLAKRLLKEFEDISGLLNSSRDKLMNIDGVTQSICTHIMLIKETLNRSMKSAVADKNILSSWGALIEYLRASQGNAPTERLRVLFLNKKNCLVADEVQDAGTIDQTPVYPREIIKRVLFNNASAIILVHNHPSGNPKPSKADITLTSEIESACKTIGVIVHDHVIVCKNEFYSFKSNMLL